MPVVTTIPATKPRYAAEKTKQKKQNRKNKTEKTKQKKRRTESSSRCFPIRELPELP